MNPIKPERTAPDLRDVLVLVGVLLTGTGIWLIYPPAALIAVGVFLAALGLWGSVR